MRKKKTLYFLAVLFILVGILLTLENLNLIGGISRHWPVFLLILGAGFILLFLKSRRDEFLVWFGSFVFLLGGFFYILNFTSWSSLATLWPVFLGLVGLSFLVTGALERKRIFVYFAVIFISLSLVLTLVFAISTGLWPLSLVFFGLSLLVLHSLKSKERENEYVQR